MYLQRDVNIINVKIEEWYMVHINHQLGLSISVHVQLKCQLEVSWPPATFVLQPSKTKNIKTK